MISPTITIVLFIRGFEWSVCSFSKMSELQKFKPLLRAIKQFRIVAEQYINDAPFQKLLRQTILYSIIDNLNYCSWYNCVYQMRRLNILPYCVDVTDANIIPEAVRAFYALRGQCPEFCAFRRSLLRTCVEIAQCIPNPEVEDLLACAVSDFDLPHPAPTDQELSEPQELLTRDWQVHQEEISILIIHIYALLKRKLRVFNLLDKVLRGPKEIKFAPITHYLVCLHSRVPDRELYMDKKTALTMPIMGRYQILHDLLTYWEPIDFERRHDGKNIFEWGYLATKEVRDIIWEAAKSHQFNKIKHYRRDSVAGDESPCECEDCESDWSGYSSPSSISEESGYHSSDNDSDDL
jgi:hypothetical protein